MSLLKNWNIAQEKLESISVKKSISPSEIVSFEECPFKWKLTYKDRVSKFETNIDFLFGKAAHEAIQEAFKANSFSNINCFFEKFKAYIEKEKANLKEKDFKKLDELLMDAHNIFDNFEENFNKEVDGAIDIKNVSEVSVEEKLVESANTTYLFSGRLDLVFKHDKKYHIWDIKTSKTAWKIDKRNNIAILSQPILYKVFWAKKHNIEKIRDISTAFLILKKKGGNSPIDYFKVSSGPVAMKRCSDNLEYFTDLISKNKFLKRYNKFICKWCEFNDTKYCPGDKSF